MSGKPSLGMQAASMRHCLSIARRSGDANDSVISSAEAGIRTLDWLDRHSDVARVLAVLFDTFPGLQLVEARDVGGK